MSLRVVAGAARGRRIQVPPGQGTRPTSDRVREAMFNALSSLGAIDQAAVLDLFAGSGALAIEALSRGASRATLVESDAVARRLLAENLADCGLAEQATVVTGDGIRHLERTDERYDLALLDPPYEYEDWPELLDKLVPRLLPGAVVVIESRQAPALVEPLALARGKRYGSTVVTFAQMPVRLSPPDAAHVGDHE